MRVTNRRDFLKATTVLGATLAVGAEFAVRAKGTSEPGDSWTTFRGNPGRTGATTDSGPDSNVHTEWSFDLNGGMATVEPVVANGTIYLAVTTKNSSSSSEGYVAAYDQREGAVVWKRDDISRPGTPTLGDGTIYFDTYGSEDAEATGFYALDSNTGETKWHREKSLGFTNPIVVDGTLFADVADGVAQLDPETGDQLWKTNGVHGSACYADGTLFAGTGMAVDTGDGSVRWDTSADDDELQTVADGTVYGVVNTGKTNHAVTARSADDGAVQWKTAVNLSDYWVGDQLTVADGRVYFHAGEILVALDAKSGKAVWTHEANATLAGAVTVADGTLYAGGRAGSEAGDAVLLAIDAASGDERWRHELGGWDSETGPAANSPVIVDGKAYTSTFPMGSTEEGTYTQYGDFYVLGSDGEPTTTTTTTETTSTGETTTETNTTTTGTTETTADTTTTTGSTTSTTGTTGTGTTSTTGTGTASGTTGTNTTGTSMTNTSAESGGTGTSAASTSTSTTTNGQPGFGILTGVGGLAGLGAALSAKFGDRE